MTAFTKLCSLSMAAIAMALPALAGPLTIELNKTSPLHLRGTAASVVLGNANVADVVVHDENLLFITGKSFGTTNLLVFDKNKRQIFSSEITVVADEANTVTVNRNGANYTYDCSPDCRPALSLGDEPGHFGQQAQQQRTIQQSTDSD